MKSFSSNAVSQPSLASSRRQSTRQTRTNPSRSATMVGPQRGLGASRAAQDDRQNPEIGFFPAITHFTDSISALPKEMVRHYSMLKEVDAKICGPEEVVGQLVTTALQTPAPPRKPALVSQHTDTSRSEVDTVLSTAGTADNISLKSVPSRVEAASTATQDNLATFDLPRRQLFYRLRVYLQEMLPILDEKNHVLSTASDCLENQLKRCSSSYRHMDNEISEEARYGSLAHWAYNDDKAADKRGTTAGERSRRDTAAANHLAANAPAVHEVEGAALRSELRREAMAARKSRNQHLESDFDDSRAPTGKKSHGVGKGRKVADVAPSINGATVGLGIANGASTAAPPSKKRKIEKAASGATLASVPMARAMSSVYGSNTGPNRGAATSPRATPTLEPPKKRGRVAALPNGAARKRANTNTSAANSPSIASSPVVGTFLTSKDGHVRSPAPSLMQRVPSSRGRQNSTQSVVPEARTRPPSSTSNKATNSNGTNGTTTGVEKVAGLTGRSVDDVRASMKETVNANGDHLIEESGKGGGDLRGAILVGNRGLDKLMKKEEVDNTTPKIRQDRSRSISISTRGNGKASKPFTPTQGSFNESQRSRPSRGNDPGKRSHKKGAGLAAQLAASQRVQNGDASSLQGDDDDDDEESEPSAPTAFHASSMHLFQIRRWILESPPIEWAIWQLRELLVGALRQGPVPQHVAFVMDGNRRFAKNHRMETVEGHHLGFEALAKVSTCLSPRFTGTAEQWHVQVLEVCYKSGVKVVTVYAFSIENFKRSKYEVDGLMDMAKVKLAQMLQHGDLLDRYGVSIRVSGQRELIKPDLLADIDRATKSTHKNANAILNVCFPYTSHEEITTAIRTTVVDFSKLLPTQQRPFSESHIKRTIRSRHLSVAASTLRDRSRSPSSGGTSDVEDSASSSTTLNPDSPPVDSPLLAKVDDGSDEEFRSHYPDPESITTETLNDHMYTAGLPPLDLLIRTSGVERLSDFMLWQCHENTEIVFLKCLWPEFDLWSFLPVLVEWQWRRKKEVERERAGLSTVKTPSNAKAL
ncbi:MAG: hypothetical protein Q9170_006106 [Blastenia crenularia]